MTTAPPVRARVAVAAMFMLNSLAMGSWVPRIPGIKERLDLSAASLGVALLGPAIGSLIAMPLVGRACTRFGSAVTTRVLAVAYCLTVWMPGLAGNLPELMGLLLLWGLFMGGLDVAMNAQGVSVEHVYGRPVLSSFHAAWSLGSLLGALIGSLGAGLEVAVPLQQGVVAAVSLVVVLPTTRWFLADPAHEPAGPAAEPARRRIDLRLVALGVAGTCALLSEGSVADWSGVLLRDDVGVRAGQVGFAYAAFTALMTLGRMIGDRVVHRAGRARTLVVLGGVGALGAAGGLLSGTLVGLTVGFGLLGLGLATMVPIYFSTAADTDGPAGPPLAFVSSVGYTGFLIGPTAIGLLAQATSVPAALWLVPVLTALGVVLGVMAVRLTARRKALAASAVDARQDVLQGG